MRAEDYTFSMIPDPLAVTTRVGGPAKRVWTCIYSWRRMGRERWKLTGARLSRIVKLERRNLAREVSALQEAGLLEVRVVELRSGGRRTEFRDLWPDWLSAEGSGFLLAQSVGGADEDDNEDAEDSLGGHNLPCVKGTHPMRQGDAPHASRGRTIKSPSPKSPSRRVKDVASEDATTSDLPEEFEEVNLDGGTREAEAVLLRKKEERAEKREAEMSARKARRGPRAVGSMAVPESGADLRETPSKRPEWNRWRDRSTNSWTGEDMVGFWVCRFAEVRREEDPDLMVSNVRAQAAAGLAKQVRAYVTRNLGSVVAYREAVDRVLAEAPAREKPVCLRYWMGDPQNPGTLASLDRPRKGGRTPSPIEINDALGSDVGYWDRRAAEELEKRKRKAAKLGIPLHKVGVRSGEVVE